MRTVLTYGTFDLLHIGHLRLLQRAATLGDRLVVGVSTDEFCAKKGKEPAARFEERIALVAALSCVDEAIPEHSWEQKLGDLDKYRADVVVMGGDWFGKFDHLPATVAYLPRTPGVSSTERRER